MAQWYKQLSRVGKWLTVGVPLLATATTLFFTFRPNAKPDAGPIKAALTNLDPKPNTPLGQMADARNRFSEDEQQLAGVYVHFDYEVQGLRNKDLTLKWVLRDAKNGAVVPVPEPSGYVPIALAKPTRTDFAGSADVWVRTASMQGTYYVTLELWQAGRRLTSANTRTFECSKSGECAAPPA